MIKSHQHLSIQIHRSPHCIILHIGCYTSLSNHQHSQIPTTVNSNTLALAKNMCKNLGFTSQRIPGAFMKFSQHASRNFSTVQLSNNIFIQSYNYYYCLHRDNLPRSIKPPAAKWNRQNTATPKVESANHRDT